MPGEQQLMQKPTRKTGIGHFLAAASYSAAGLRRLLRESAFRQEAGLGLVALAGLGLLGAGWAELLGFAGLILVLVAVEALNTAIEVLVDHLSPGWSQFAKDAKDLGSLAVACIVGAMVLYAGWAVFN
jgi:diacylglycerol kinase (ATP)